MLSAEDNRLLTQSDSGSPMGELLRRFWLPVLLSEERDFETWLSGSPSEAFALARSFDPARMRIVQSGFEKKDLLAA